MSTSTGNLGMTIERLLPRGASAEELDDNPCIDLFVSSDLAVHGEGVKMLPGHSERQSPESRERDRAALQGIVDSVK